MRRNVFVILSPRLQLLSLLFLALSPTLGAADDRCNYLVETVRNTEIKKSLGSYDHNARRSSSTYLQMLPNSFTEKLRSLGEDGLVIDTGAGFGFAMMDLSRQFKGSYHAINQQDFWKMFGSPEFRGRAHHYFPMLENQLKLNTLPMSYHRIPREHQDQFRIDLIHDRFKDIQKDGRYRYAASQVEDYLVRLPERADVITDIFGAFFYSSPRHQLLDLMYDRLKPGGVAYLILREKPEGVRPGYVMGPGEIVTVHIQGRPSEMTLESYLVENYPEIFEVENNRILVMRKSARELKLREKLKVLRYENAYFDVTTNLRRTIYEEVP